MRVAERPCEPAKSEARRLLLGARFTVLVHLPREQGYGGVVPADAHTTRVWLTTALAVLDHAVAHRLNDVLATVLACVPTGSRIDVYRGSHLLHHGRFGTRDDPDRANYRHLELEKLDRSGALRYARGALRRMRAYRRGWKETSGGLGALPVLPFLWGGVLAVGPAILVWRRRRGRRLAARLLRAAPGRAVRR